MTSEGLYYSLTSPEAERNLVIQSNYIAWSIVISYIIFTKMVGPSIMKNRKPMDLQLTMLLYNLFLVACNAYLAAQFTMLAVEMWPYRCSFENSPIKSGASNFYNVAFITFLVKFFELFDTVIFVLRKKFQQVSILHVYHHSTVFTLVWIGLKFRLGSYYVILSGSINCAIHVALYLYYGLSALGPSVRKYLWWKKYLTTLQIVQFFVIMAYMTYSSMTNCDKFRNFDLVCYIGLVIVTVLFFNFYIRTYIPKKKSS